MQKMTREGKTTAVKLVIDAFENVADNDDDLEAWAGLDGDAASVHVAELVS